MKKGTLIICIISALVVGCITGVAASLAAFDKQNERTSNSAGANDKINAIWNLVERKYVDRIDNDSVVDRVCWAMLSTLDPHSSYLSGKELAMENEAIRGNFEGVGIMLRKIGDTICALQVINGSPSEMAGILAGDRLLMVDGNNIIGSEITIDSVVSLIRGPRGSTVDITVSRPGKEGLCTYAVVRNVIPTPSVNYSGMIDKTTGYIRIDRFASSTYKEFCLAVRDLKDKGMKQMVLDLRDNSGGLLSEAIGICDELLPGRELIVYTQGAHERRREEHSRPGGLFSTGKLIVMIDEFSASASEIVAGAIQDNDRGIIVGRRSFGKGLVQQQFDLPGNSAVRITTSRYYTPSGRCIQRPYDRGTDEYYAEFIQSVVEQYEGDSLLSHINDSTPYHTANGRIVYGGGGIYPDHIIRYKTDSNIVYYNKLINRSIISDFAFDIISANGQSIKKRYPTDKSFIDQYTVSDAVLQNLFARAEKEGIARDPKCISRYREEIRSRLKASIGSMLYSPSVFYAVQLKYDPELNEAVNVKYDLQTEPSNNATKKKSQKPSKKSSKHP